MPVETFQTFEEFTQFINEGSAEIINAPWSQAIAEAAKTIPDNAETAEIISIVKETTTQGGNNATGALALTGSSVAAGGAGLYSVVGGITSVGLTVAIAAGAVALGVGIGVVAGEKLYDANPELWGRISDAVLPACLKFEAGSEPEQPQVPLIVGIDDKTYLPKEFMDLLKDALINEHMTAPDNIVPTYDVVGSITISSSNFTLGVSGAINKVLDEYNGPGKSILRYGLLYLNAHANIPDGSKLYYCEISISDASDTPDQYGRYGLYNILFEFLTPTGLEYVNNKAGSVIDTEYQDTGIHYLIGNTNGLPNNSIYWATLWYQGEEDENPEIYEGIRNSGELWFPVEDCLLGDGPTSLWKLCNVVGTNNTIRPAGVSITTGAILPDLNTPIGDTYPDWETEWITITKPPTIPGEEPDSEEPYIPVEIPTIDPEIGENSQEDGQKGDISTVPQEMPIVIGLPEIIKIVEPAPGPGPQPEPTPSPDPDPIPDPSPEPEPGPTPSPSPNPSPTPIPEPTPTPSPEPSPEPDPEPQPQPQPQPQPEPVPPNPPTPPVDDGIPPAIDLPIVDPTTGIGGVYSPSRSKLIEFSQWLWSTNFIDQIQKLFQTPADAIISLHQIYAQPIVGGSKNIYCGYLDSGVSTSIVTNQFATIDCGTVSVPNKYYNATDYSPYTSVDIYLPFIGVCKLSADDVIGGTVNVTYRIDVLSGACLASVKCNRGNLSGVLYTFEGNCACQMPVSGASFGGPMAGLMTAGAVGLGIALTGGGAAAAVATKATVGAASGFIGGAKTSIQKSGTFAGSAGALGCKKPYIIIGRPISCDASDYHRFYGKPANETKLLSTLTGYTRVKSVHVENISIATSEEKLLIESMLKEGVII